jgi:hypothetical protein
MMNCLTLGNWELKYAPWLIIVSKVKEKYKKLWRIILKVKSNSTTKHIPNPPFNISKGFDVKYF